MRLISWNVNGLRACMNKGFMDFFKTIHADIFCIQESKMQKDQATFDFLNYEEYWNSAEKKGYSGVAIFSKQKPLGVEYDMGITHHDKEGRI
ncbi:exodeoxyribonuclease III, partial [Helicobacter rodentium]